MEGAVVLRVLILCATVWNGCCFPAKGSTGQQPASGSPGPVFRPGPVFDPRYITYLQQYYHSLAPATSAGVQQSAPAPPQAPVQSSQNAPQMTSPIIVKGSMPQTSSGFQEQVANPQTAKGQLESSAPAYGAPQTSPAESLPAAFAEAEPNVAEMLESPEVLVLGEPRLDDSPPFPPPAPQYVPGTAIRNMNTNEFGLDLHESYDVLQNPAPVPLASETVGPAATSPVIRPREDLELDDQFFHMFITGQLPPGTVTHTSSTFERGRNGWATIGYERIAPPARRTSDASSKSQHAPKMSGVKKY